LSGILLLRCFARLIGYDGGMPQFTIKDIFRWTFFIALGIGIYRTQPWPLWIYWMTPIATLLALVGYHQIPIVLQLSGLTPPTETPVIKPFLFAVAIYGLVTGLPGLLAGIFLGRPHILVAAICSTTIGLAVLLIQLVNARKDRPKR
jgi:hypothetical protein